MTVDPRSLNYPGHGETDNSKEGVEPDPHPADGNRRTGTNDELKELDRAERRKSD